MESYSTETVLTPIPKNLIGITDQSMLIAFGASFDSMLEDKWYIYASSGFDMNTRIDPLDISFLSAARFKRDLLEKDYPNKDCRPDWVKKIAADWSGDVSLNEFMRQACIDPYEVIQGLLLKPNNSGESALTEIMIEGAYWANKSRPGEFGGVATQITRERIQSISTPEMLRDMHDARSQEDLEHIITQLKNAAQHVIDSWEGSNLDSAVRALNQVLMTS